MSWQNVYTIYCRQTDSKGHILAHYEKKGVKNPIIQKAPLVEDSEIRGQRLYSSHFVVAGGEKVGSLVVISNLKELSERSDRYVFIGIFVTLIALAIAISVASLLQKVVSGPIRNLSKVIERVTDNGDYLVEINHKELNEMGTLITGFNQMISEIHLRDLDLKNVNINLEQSQNQLSEFFDNAPFCLNRLSPEGSILEANNVCLEIFGASSDRYVGQLFEDFFEHPASIRESLAIIRSGSKVENLDLKLSSSVDSERIIRLNANGHWENGELVHTRCFVQDITVLNQIEQARNAKDRAERANQAKSEYLSRMSHELRTPMNAILGFSQLLEMQELTKLQEEWVEQIMKGGRHLLNLINDVLNISKIESGILSISTEPVELLPLILDTLQMVQPIATKKEISFNIDSSSLEGVLAQADLQKLSQVLINVFSNAVKYNVPKGSIEIELERSDQERLIIAVTDTGIGISEDKVCRLFTPFDRLGAEHTQEEGTGLGLSHSRCIMDAMGGSLSFDLSYSGSGSRFLIEIAESNPAKARSQAANHSATSGLNSSSDGNTCIVLIEDNELNSRVIECALSNLEHIQLSVASCGHEGIDLIEQVKPDIIILDNNLPDIEGHEIATILRSNPNFAKIPIIVLTADATSGTKRRFANLKIEHYLTKPVNLKELLLVIEDISGQKLSEAA